MDVRYPSLLLLLGLEGKPKCVGTEGGHCVPEDPSGRAVGIVAVWGHYEPVLPVARRGTREVLKERVVPVDKVYFQYCPMEVSRHQL